MSTDPTHRATNGSHNGNDAAAPDALPEPLELEPEDAPDACPACGAPIRDPSRGCVRCRLVAAPKADAPPDETSETVEGDDEESPPAAEADARPDFEGPPLCRPSDTDRWLPLALVAVGVLLVLGSGLFGRHGLFPAVATTETVPWPARLAILVRVPVLLGLTTACIFGGVASVAWLTARRLGPVDRVLLRVTGVASLSCIAVLIRLPMRSLEFVAEMALAAAIVWVALMGLFRIGPRDAGTATGLAASYLFAIAMIFEFIAWCI